MYTLQTNFNTFQNVVTNYLETSPAERQRCQHPSDERLELLYMPLERLPQLDHVRSQKLTKAVLNDVSKNDCQWDERTRVQAWKLLKELSRLQIPSRALSSEAQIRELVQSIRSLKDTCLSRSEMKGVEKQDETFEQLDLALRVLNNVLFQHNEGRQVYGASSVGMQCCLDLLESSDKPMITFLCARLIFFATMTPTNVLKEAVQTMQLVEILTIKFTSLIQQQLTPEVDMAMTEILKAFFNVSLHLPRLTKVTNAMQNSVNTEFDVAILPFLAPTVRLLMDSQQRQTKVELISPYTNAIAVLLNYPIQPYEQIWQTGVLPTQHEEVQKVQDYGKKGKNRSSSSGGCSDSDKSSTDSMISRSRRIANSLFRSPFQKIAQQNYASQQFDSSLPANLLITNLLNMLESFCDRYFASHDIDDRTAKEKAIHDDVDLQAIGEPTLLLLQKMANRSETFRNLIKSRILPDNIDRNIGLDKRDDLTGIIIRLMGSQNYPRLARASGEIFLALCGGSSSQMTAEIGYGPCAGFLTNIGQGHAIPSESKKDSQGRLLDPITGKILPTAEEIEREDAELGISKMTEEEKEAEAERLFSLFDRLDRTGIVKVDPNSHPMRKAVETGRIQEIDEEEEKRRIEQEENEEKELEESVYREMRQFREKQKRNVP